MGVTTKRLLISFGTILGCAFFALPTLAASDYYANADTGNDDNSCLSADEACLTIAGAEAKMVDRDNASNITLHLAGTFTEQIYIDDVDVTAPNTLDGLRITATDPDSMPTIDAGGADYAVQVTDIHSVTIDHLNVKNARLGIYVGGDYEESVNNVQIKNNTVSDISSTSDAGTTMAGIYAYYTKNIDVMNNTVDGVNLTLTNGTNTEYMYGIAVGGSTNVSVKNNTVNDVTMTNDISADSTFHQGYVYGISVNSGLGSSVRNNIVTNIAATGTTNVDAISMYMYAYGITVNGGFDTVVSGNTVETIDSGTIASSEGVTAYTTVYGIDVNAIQRQSDGNNMVRNNTVSDISLNSTADTVSNFAYGITITAVEKLKVRNNDITALNNTAAATEDNSSISGALFGMTLNTITQGTVRNNTVSQFTNSLTGFGDSDALSGNIYGLNFTTASNVSVLNNVIKDFTVTVDNQDVSDYYDALRLYGIYWVQGSNNIIRNNSIRDFTLQDSSAGESGNMYVYDFGIYTYRVENVTVQKNTYKDVTSTINVNDPSDASNGYVYSYGLYLTDASDISALGNTLKNVNHTGDSTTGSYIAFTIYGMWVANSPNSQLSNNTVKSYTQTSSADAGNTQLYGIEISRSPDTLVSDNRLQAIATTHTGDTTTATTYGMYISNSSPLYVNANVFRNNSVAAVADTYMYGIYFNDDASKTYLTNNVVLGSSTTESEYDYGVYIKDSATKTVMLYNNTLVDWAKTVSLLGGTKYTLKNNILAARGTGSHVLEVDDTQIDLDSIKSDYNLLYNETFSDQLVYDVGDSAAISYADWKQLYKHDRKSLNKKPKIKSSGVLKKTSKAINRGTKNYSLAKKSLVYQLLSTDVFGTDRPIDTKGRVDIGADEFTKKK